MAGKLYKKVERCYNAGEVIFEQGAPSDGIYSVKIGRVSVYKTKPTPNGPADMEIVRLGPGSMFGEMGMLDQTQRDASVRALEYTECVVITQDMFENQMASLPPWVVNFIKILISRLRITNDKLLSSLQLLEAHGLAPADDQEGAQAAAVAQGGAESPAQGSPTAVPAPKPPAPAASPKPAAKAPAAPVAKPASQPPKA